MSTEKSSQLWCTPLLHPAHITRGRFELEEAQENALHRLADVVRAGHEPPYWDTSQPPDGAWLYPSLKMLDEWKAELFLAGHDAVVYDLETAGDYIICVGMAGLTLESGELGRVLCLRFRLQGGRHYWANFHDHTVAVQFLASLLDNPRLANVFHNGVSFDVPLLVQHGFRVRGPLWDTMVMSSRAYPEMPKGLQFLATRYLWASVWKTLVRPEEEEEGKS
jgi:hypothetical protein